MYSFATRSSQMSLFFVFAALSRLFALAALSGSFTLASPSFLVALAVTGMLSPEEGAPRLVEGLLAADQHRTMSMMEDIVTYATWKCQS